MKKSLRENPDAGLLAIVLFFLALIIAGMWIYQVKVLQKRLPQAKPAAISAKKPAFQSLVLHGELNQINVPGNQTGKSDERPDKSSAGSAAANRTAAQSANLSRYVTGDYSPASIPGFNQASALPELKINNQTACAAASYYADCIDKPLSTVGSLIKKL